MINIKSNYTIQVTPSANNNKKTKLQASKIKTGNKRCLFEIILEISSPLSENPKTKPNETKQYDTLVNSDGAQYEKVGERERGSEIGEGREFGHRLLSSDLVQPNQTKFTYQQTSLLPIADSLILVLLFVSSSSLCNYQKKFSFLEKKSKLISPL